jgi:hypothetical protein
MSVSTSIWAAAQDTLAKVKTYLGSDGMTNFEPIHDPLTELDAAHVNKVRAGLAEVALRTRKGILVPFHFYAANATANQTGVALKPESADTDKAVVVSPSGGSVVALTVHAQNARTAGTLTVNWRKGGVAGTLAAVVNGTDTQKARARQLPGAETFAALDSLDLTYTSSSNWAAGTTPSIWATIWVSIGEEEAL